MKMNKMISTLASMVLVSAIPASAATIFTDRAAFIEATTDQVIDDFEENPSSGFTSYGTPGLYNGANFTIASPNQIFTVDPDFDPGFYEWNSGDMLVTNFAQGTITVGPDVTAFGFDFGNPSNPLAASSAGLVTINGFNYTEIGQPTFNFFGVVGDGPLGPTVIDFNGGWA